MGRRTGENLSSRSRLFASIISAAQAPGAVSHALEQSTIGHWRKLQRSRGGSVSEDGIGLKLEFARFGLVDGEPDQPYADVLRVA